MYQCQFKSGLAFLKPKGLLAAAGWGGAAERNHQVFWHERSSIKVDPELVALAIPFLAREREEGSRFAKALAAVMPMVSISASPALRIFASHCSKMQSKQTFG